MINLFDNKEIANTKHENDLPLIVDPNLQDKLDSLPVQNAYQNDLEVRHDEGPYQPDPLEPIPSFGETFKHSAMRTISALGHEGDLNPLNDNTPQGWNAASDPNNFIGVSTRYQGHVAAATSPNDAYFRRLQALDQQKNDEYFENGSTVAKFMGGFVDGLPFMMIPLGQQMKYAQVGRSVYEGILATAPGLAAGNLLHEGTLNANEMGGSIAETIKDTYIDTVAGLAFVGGATALGHGFTSLKLYDARKVMDMHFNGIVPEIKVDADGKVLGYVATPITGESVGAAKINNAQAFLDSSMAQNGLFAIPYIGGLLGKGAAAVNPIIRGLTSPFETVRGFTDRVSSHSLITEGIKAGRAKPEDFESLMGMVQGENKMYYRQMQGLLDKRNDIESTNPAAKLAERTRKRWKDEGYISAEKFGDEVKTTIISGNSHPHGAVNEAAALTRKYLDDTWNLYREVYELPKDWMPPPTADGYFPRVYNLSLMTERPTQWKDMWVSWWKEADQEIATNMRPINEFKETLDRMVATHDALTKTKTATSEQIAQSSRELAGARRRMRKMKEDLADRIKADKRLFLHADDHAALSGTESRALKRIQKPLRMANKEYKAAKARADQLKQKKFFLESRKQQAKSVETANATIERLKVLEADLKQAEAEARAARDKRDLEEEKLQDAVAEKKISPRFYDRVPGSQRVKFKKAGNLVQFRNLFESEFHMNQQADALRDTILNQTPEDTLHQVLGHFIGARSENPILQRTQMIPDENLQANNFLSNNMPLVVSNYRNALQRKIIMKQVFGDVSVDGGIGPLTERLTAEFKDREAALIADSKLSEADRGKRLKKLSKDFKDAKEFMQNSFQRMMGRTRGGRKMREFNRFMRLWTVSTRLGSVPLTMITDLSANVYKHGFWPSVRDGLIPALENIVSRLTGKEAVAYRENAAHAHLALNTTLAAYNDRDWGGIAMEHVPLTGPVGNFMEHAAHISGNIAGTNQLENFLQRLSANIIQSKVMKYMLDHEAGTLKEKELQKLLKYGLDPKEWSKRFIKGWKERGSDGNGFGGYQSRYFEWADAEAANKMSRTIYRGVTDTIIRKGMMDAPFFFDDPLIGMISFLHGWSCAAFTRYLMPLMQRPDAEHIVGLMAMLTAGSLVSPMRKISRGEPPIDDETNMFWDAMQDSGILSPITGLIEDANILSHGRILRGFSNDRHRQKSELSAALGPIFGVGQDVTRILGMLADRKLNETDVKKAARLVPGMQPWFLKGMQNKMIESLGLPKTPSDTQGGNAYNYGV